MAITFGSVGRSTKNFKIKKAPKVKVEKKIVKKVTKVVKKYQQEQKPNKDGMFMLNRKKEVDTYGIRNLKEKSDGEK